MFFEKASGKRSLKVTQGEGMVTPTRPVVVEYRDGTKETLLPDRHRFDPGHTLVRQRPEIFQLCMARGDRSNAPARFKDALRAAERELTRPSSGQPRSRSRRNERGRGSDLRSDRLSSPRNRLRRGRYQI